MGSSRGSRQKMDSMTSKIGEKLHISGRDATKTLPFISRLMEEDDKLAEELEFTEDEAEFVSQF